MIALSPKRRSELRSQAHKLNPIVLIGEKGLTDEVVAEIDRSLNAHELIKVRAATGAREQRDIWFEAICERLGAHPVQQIGKVFVIYRENPVQEPSRAPGPAEGRPRRESTATAKARVVSERRLEAQRARDAKKRKARDVAEMVRKGKIKGKAAARAAASSPMPDPDSPRRRRRTSR